MSLTALSDFSYKHLGLVPLRRPAPRLHHACMSAHGSGGSNDRDDTWTSETLPMSVRRELLERELKKLGFRRTEAGGSPQGGSVQQQQQPQGSQSGHPQADSDGGNHSN